MSERVSRFIDAALHTGILTQAQLDRCHKRIRSAASDIPPSDYAMVNALQAEGVANRFQADALLERDGPGVVLGHYLVIDRLADSGSACRAIDLKGGDEVLVKPLPRNLTETWVPLKGQHFVRAHHFLRKGRSYFVVTELVEGVDLSELLADRGRFDPPEVVEIARQMAMALLAAHKRGVYHHRLATRQLLMAPDGTIKISDFCLGPKAPATSTRNGTGDPTRSEGAVQDLCDFGSILQQLLVGVTVARSASLVPSGNTGGNGLPPNTPRKLAQLVERLRTASGSFGAKAVALALGRTDTAARQRLGRMAHDLLRSRPPVSKAGLPTRRRRRWPWLVVPLFLLAGAAAAVYFAFPSLLPW